MKFIQITDTHLVPPGEELHGLDPRARLDACVADINTNHTDAELCILTGDLTQEGQIAAYRNLRDCLSRLAIPCRLLIGNHDDRENFRKVFPETPCDEDGFVQSVIDTAAGRFVLLDTVESGEKWGSFCETRAAWLKAQLLASGDRPVFIFMHHPPFNIGIPSVDKIKLIDAGPLRGVLGQFKTIRHLFLGHVHRPVFGSWLGIPYSILRGTNHQVAFDFETVEPVPKNHESPAYAVTLVTPETVVVHFHDYLDRSALPVAAKARQVA